MPQSSKEIVRAALNFEKPDRLPVLMPQLGVSDLVWLAFDAGGYPFMGDTDIWGCVWEKTEIENMGMVKGHPLDSVADHERLKVPDYSEDRFYAHCEEGLREAEKTGVYVQAHFFMALFERMHSVVGLEPVLEALLTDRENAEALADKIVDAHITLVRNMQERFGERVHGFQMSDDWGTQQAAFVSMDLWNDFFRPRYKKLFDAMHEGGQDVTVHSCGKINEVIQGFIDAGVDCLNMMQPRTLGIEEVGQRYRGKVTFSSTADIQSTLPTGRRDLVEADARALAEHWMLPEGGFILSSHGADEAIGSPAGMSTTVYECFKEVSRAVYGAPLPDLPVA